MDPNYASNLADQARQSIQGSYNNILSQFGWMAPTPLGSNNALPQITYPAGINPQNLTGHNAAFGPTGSPALFPGGGGNAGGAVSANTPGIGSGVAGQPGTIGAALTGLLASLVPGSSLISLASLAGGGQGIAGLIGGLFGPGNNQGVVDSSGTAGGGRSGGVTGATSSPGVSPGGVAGDPGGPR